MIRDDGADDGTALLIVTCCGHAAKASHFDTIREKIGAARKTLKTVEELVDAPCQKLHL